MGDYNSAHRGRDLGYGGGHSPFYPGVSPRLRTVRRVTVFDTVVVLLSNGDGLRDYGAFNQEQKPSRVSLPYVYGVYWADHRQVLPRLAIPRRAVAPGDRYCADPPYS